MKYDITVFKGDRDKPAVVFIHGLGMDKRIWESPEDARVLGGRFPLRLLLYSEPDPDIAETGSRRLFLGKPPGRLTTIFHDLKEQGYTLIAWSQKRPAAEISIAASELRDVIKIYEDYCKNGIVLIGHSRGGLIAREYLKYGDKRVRVLITLSTPHKGSRLAQWADYIAPLVSIINPLLSDSEKGTLAYTVKRVFDFLESKAVKELLPESRFFKSIDDGRVDGIYYISFGGKDPTLFCVYRGVSGDREDGGQKRFVLRPKRVFAIPGIFEKLFPERHFPDEMKKGMGDGLVTTESSKLQWADEHYNFDVNHAGILFQDKARLKVTDVLKDRG